MLRQSHKTVPSFQCRHHREEALPWKNPPFVSLQVPEGISSVEEQVHSCEEMASEPGHMLTELFFPVSPPSSTLWASVPRRVSPWTRPCL